MTNITADFGEEAKSLLTLKSDKQCNNGFIIENPHFNERENLRKAELPAQSENMYLVVRSLKNQEGKQDYTIKEKDIIKLGRVKFKIKECCTELHPVKPQFDAGLSDSEDAIEIERAELEKISSDTVCRFCWTNDNTQENPLLSSCKCDGSMRYIHYECIKNWLKVKMVVKASEH